VVFDDKAGVQFFDGPRRREAAGRGHEQPLGMSEGKLIRSLSVPEHDRASRFHAGITPLDLQCSMENIALNDSGAI
jgi:hypothetical protein